MSLGSERLGPFCQLASDWKVEADRLAARGMEDYAKFQKAMIRDFEDRMMLWIDQELTLEEAARETGMAYSTVQQKVASGEIPNAGEKGRPRVRRGDLNRATSRVDGWSVAGEVVAREAEG